MVHHFHVHGEFELVKLLARVFREPIRVAYNIILVCMDVLKVLILTQLLADSYPIKTTAFAYVRKKTFAAFNILLAKIQVREYT